ncbi:Uncharacterized protein DBV15_04759 [Temnothorax longispinosus]|uniref:Uncharacterized protein n=1 Tax=Temnothorax longispinosus TaxID=300112 RepID=A0A4S2L6I3_9HYME|nr:Uncharacterized protein DBV15_04759 [Temnothorax longispinosus]
MTAYLKFNSDLQAIVKLEPGKIALLDSGTSLQRLTIVGGNEWNEIKTRIRRQHNGKCMGRREKAQRLFNELWRI